MAKKIVWYDATNLKKEKSTLPLLSNYNFDSIIINRNMYGKTKFSKKTEIIVNINNETELDGLSMDVIIMTEKSNIISKAKNLGYKVAYKRLIDSRESMEEAWKIGCDSDFLVAALISDTNIPLELLIARLQGKGKQLLKVVTTSQDAEVAFDVMEQGSEGIVFNTEDIDEITRLGNYIEKDQYGKVDLLKGKVTSVEHMGRGYRACVDTTSILGKDEGMIIGSTSQGGILVSSENHFLPYMELRPFRVNAGAVHSYVWSDDDSTQYMTELKSGSKVLCVDCDGNTREVGVGRVKIEVRPLLKIEVECKGIKVNTIVQDDWHIRIFGGNGEVRNASDIKIGDELMTYICDGGRHVGIKIDETIIEQ